MKTAGLVLSVLLAAQTVVAQEVVRPNIAPAFGKQVVVQAEFVAKPNDYYSQNMVSAPYALKVTAVDGRKLKEPVLVEYELHVNKDLRAGIERPGTSATFEAFESLYQPPVATPWLGDGEQGMAFALVHLLHVRPRQKSG